MDFLEKLDGTLIIKVLVVLIAMPMLIKLTQKIFTIIADKFSGIYRLYILALIPLSILIIILSSVLLILGIIEPSFENLMAFFGALGLALGFAFKDYSSSLVGGIITLIEMPYRPGDWITIEGVYGEVKAIGIRSVEIITPDDTAVIIPHLKLWDKLIFNSNRGTRNLLCVADFFLHPNHNPSRVIQLLYDVGLTSAFLQLKKPIQVMVLEKPYGTYYRLKAYPVDPRDQFRFITELTVRGKMALKEADVKFATSYISPDV